MSVIVDRMQKIVDNMIKEHGPAYTAGYLESQLAMLLHEIPEHRAEWVLKSLEFKFEVEKTNG
jgi:hypothetical protein